MSADEEIAAYYGRGEEQQRLFGPFRLEFVRTQELLARHLPEPPAVVLDVGGGPGTYAAWLAERGYEVHLLDPIELHVRQAREAPSSRLASAEIGDARALPQADASADAVLLLGPLYHLQEAADRRRALEEARRVLKPGGLLAAAAISRFASTIDGLRRELLLDPTSSTASSAACGTAATRTPHGSRTGSPPPTSTSPPSWRTRSARPAST